MVTSAQALKKYGPPETEKFMVLWDVPSDLELGAIPKRIYCNRDLVQPLTRAFQNIRDRDGDRHRRPVDCVLRPVDVGEQLAAELGGHVGCRTCRPLHAVPEHQ